MATTMYAPVHTTVIAAFTNRDRARAAMADLRRAGFSDFQIELHMPVRPPQARRTATILEQVILLGAGLGAASGGLIGLALGISLLIANGSNAWITALAAWCVSCFAGMAVGAFVGTLVGMSMREDGSAWEASELDAGRAIVMVHDTDERSEDARSILRHNGGSIEEPTEVGTYGGGLPSTPY